MSPLGPGDYRSAAAGASVRPSQMAEAAPTAPTTPANKATAPASKAFLQRKPRGMSRFKERIGRSRARGFRSKLK